MPDLSTLAALDSIDPATKVAIAVRIKSIWTVMTEVGKFPELWSIVIIIFVSGVIGFIRMIQREFKLAINKLARIVFKWSATILGILGTYVGAYFTFGIPGLIVVTMILMIVLYIRHLINKWSMRKAALEADKSQESSQETPAPVAKIPAPVEKTPDTPSSPAS